MYSVILNDHQDYLQTLANYLAPVQVPGKTWRRCYRGSEQSFSATSFHSNCDNKGPTVTLVRVNENVFGGYTDKSWTSPASKNLLSLINFDPILSIEF